VEFAIAGGIILAIAILEDKEAFAFDGKVGLFGGVNNGALAPLHGGGRKGEGAWGCIKNVGNGVDSTPIGHIGAGGFITGARRGLKVRIDYANPFVDRKE
jgi:hypothetical protein